MSEVRRQSAYVIPTLINGRARLRERLLEMRDEMILRMSGRGEPEPGHLGLISGIAATLAVLDAPTLPDAPVPSATPIADHVLVDGNRLTLSRGSSSIAVLALDDDKRLALAEQLLDAVS